MVHNVKVITFYYHDTQMQVINMFQISIHVSFAIIKLIIALEQGQRQFVFEMGVIFVYYTEKIERHHNHFLQD